MGRAFEGRNEAEVPASPEQVWDAIATGPGIDSWFMGRNEVEPGQGGTVRMAFGQYTPESTVTAWDPPHHFAHRSEEAPDGRFIAYEFLVEGRDSGSTVLRMVASGFLPGDDWETEYDAMTKGGALFFSTLVTYLGHFAGRTATPITVFGPLVTDWPHAWSVLHRELGLAGTIAEGDRVRFTPDELGEIDGAVYHTNPQALGVRTGDALYRFIQGLNGPMIASHHLFAGGIDQGHTEQAWRGWLTRLLG
jgi:uncharacterized protein YndB with AHSA1/START domain